MNWLAPLTSLLLAVTACAEVGDPQLKTDHPWYPGELAISTFERLSATQAEVYRRETGREVSTDEDKALASWYWRNLHYAHCQEGVGDYFDSGFANSDWNREYWHGLFAHGMSLCGTTHAQWSAEMDWLLGPCRSRSVGVTGHNSFEVFLTGGDYGEGRWVLLDHDVSTVVFDAEGNRLVSIQELLHGDQRLLQNQFQPQRQRGWRISGLYEKDVQNLYDSYSSASYLAGYEGPPPLVHLRRGETLRRYLRPGLEDGKTYVYWGLNLPRDGIPGPQRDRTWVNQPQNMLGADHDAGSLNGRLRYANAVYTYRPRFDDGSYREGVVSEGEDHVTFEFQTPYVIGATPATPGPWSIYEDGCSGGLIVTARGLESVSVSTDCGTSWRQHAFSRQQADLTDSVKGHQQCLLRFDANRNTLASTELTIRTVCQMNAAVVPRLRSGTNQITYEASGQGIVQAGPNRDQAESHLIAGEFDRSDEITLALATPRGETITSVFAASHNQSGNPPNPDVTYSIDLSADAGATWSPIVTDQRIERRQPEPPDLWSQSFTYGHASPAEAVSNVQIRFRNSGRKTMRRAEAHLLYAVANPSEAIVTFAWTEDGKQQRTAQHRVPAGNGPQTWTINASGDVETSWVEIAVP